MLYLGGLSTEVEQTLFGINIFLILITQEKDSSTGEIKYSVIPLILNNSYLFFSNLRCLTSSQPLEQEEFAASPSSVRTHQKKQVQPVNKSKVFYGSIWYIGSLVGYGLMENYSQGLHLGSSREMFLFTASETLFMVSMALSYFYCWQTYAPTFEHEDMDVIPLEYGSALKTAF